MANSEEKLYNDLINNEPSATTSNATTKSMAAISQAENVVPKSDYNNTYSGKVDTAIQSWLNNRGFEYDPNKDKAYQHYRQEYEKNSALARNASLKTANQLAGGFNPTYADTIAGEIYNDRMASVGEAEPMFKQLAQQDYQAQQNKFENIANIYSALDNTDYARGRDKITDYKSYLNLLANRYATDRQSDVGVDAANAEIYGTRLAGLQRSLEDARNINNQRYLYNNISADSAAQIAQAERENNQKIAYDKAKDAYDAKIAEAKVAQKRYKEEDERRNKRVGTEFINAYNLKDASYDFQVNQVAMGVHRKQINAGEAGFIMDKLNISLDDVSNMIEIIERNGGTMERRYDGGNR